VAVDDTSLSAPEGTVGEVPPPVIVIAFEIDVEADIEAKRWGGNGGGGCCCWKWG